MAVIVIGNEKNFAALRPRLFAGSVSTKVAGEVTAAIEQANPGVDLAKLVPGTVIQVPDDLPHVVVEPGVSLDESSRKAIAGTLESSVGQVAQLVTDANARAADAAAERKQLVSALGTKAIKAATRQDTTIAAEVKAAKDSLDAAAALEKTRQDALAEALKEWTAELTELQALLPLG